MKLEIERSGGFAGLTKKITVDTEDLPREIADNIKKHLDDSSLLKSSPLPMSKKKRFADSYFYRICGKLGKRQQEIKFNESEVNDELKFFIDYIFKNY